MERTKDRTGRNPEKRKDDRPAGSLLPTIHVAKRLAIMRRCRPGEVSQQSARRRPGNESEAYSFEGIAVNSQRPFGLPYGVQQNTHCIVRAVFDDK
jgi:hypothetical protein